MPTRKKRGRPPEPNSIRSEAKRRGVTMWRVRQDRADTVRTQSTKKGYDSVRESS